MSAPVRSDTVDPGRPSEWPSVRLVSRGAVPLAVAATAYALWWLSDRLLYIGPLDLAAFGWIIVIPVWLAAPVAAAFAWRRFTSAESTIAAGVVAATIGITAAILFWQSVSSPNCDFGAIRTPSEFVLPSMILGAVIGGGLAVSALLALRAVQTGHLWQGVIIGASTEAVMVVVAILVAGMTLMGSGCQRPPI